MIRRARESHTEKKERFFLNKVGGLGFFGYLHFDYTTFVCKNLLYFVVPILLYLYVNKHPLIQNSIKPIETIKKTTLTILDLSMTIPLKIGLFI